MIGVTPFLTHSFPSHNIFLDAISLYILFSNFGSVAGKAKGRNRREGVKWVRNQIFPHYVFLLFFTAVKVYCRQLIACFYLERDLIQGTSRGALFSSTAFLVKFGYCKSRRTSPPASSTPISGASDPLLLKYPPWAQPLPPSKADQAPGAASFPGLPTASCNPSPGHKHTIYTGDRKMPK